MSKAKALADLIEQTLTEMAGLKTCYDVNDVVATVSHLLAATRLEALQAQPVGEESGWLIEENVSGIIHWIALAENEWPRTEIHVRRARSGRDMMVETDKYRSPVVRVKDANEALRFARREDAEALIKLFDRFLLCPVATEHMWSAAR